MRDSGDIQIIIIIIIIIIVIVITLSCCSGRRKRTINVVWLQLEWLNQHKTSRL